MSVQDVIVDFGQMRDWFGVVNLFVITGGIMNTGENLKWISHFECWVVIIFGVIVLAGLVVEVILLPRIWGM